MDAALTASVADVFGGPPRAKAAEPDRKVVPPHDKADHTGE